MKHPIDLVVPYVNSADEEWQKDFIKTCESNFLTPNIDSERWRDMGTLVYLFRGVAQCMPWIRTVHLLVERESQVPDWIDRNQVHIVYHREIIPEWYLPTYNSGCLEMFVHKIPGLSDYYLYGNDDIFPLLPIDPEDFYDENMLPKLAATVTPIDVMGTYAFMLYNSEQFVRKILHKGTADVTKVIRMGHSINPMCKSTWEMFWKCEAETIKESLTHFRDSRNFNQDIHNYYHYLSGQYSPSDRKTKSLGIGKIETIKNVLRDDATQILCMNDTSVEEIESKFIIINHELQKKFPEKCKYEL